MNIEGLDVLFKVLDLLGTGNRNDERVLGQQPGKTELTRGTSLAFRDFCDGFSCTQVLGEILRGPDGRIERMVRRPRK